MFYCAFGGGLITCTPFLVFWANKSLFSNQINFSRSDSETFDVNITVLKNCFIVALQDQTCDMEVKDILNIDEVIKITFESEETRTMFRILGIYLSMLNSVANPVLYAFWYPDFRKYMMKILGWCQMKIVLLFFK